MVKQVLPKLKDTSIEDGLSNPPLWPGSDKLTWSDGPWRATDCDKVIEVIDGGPIWVFGEVTVEHG